MRTLGATSVLAVAAAVAISVVSAFLPNLDSQSSHRHRTRTWAESYEAFEDEDFTKLDTSKALFAGGKSPPKIIFLLSDSTGGSLKNAMTRALAQFDSCGKGEQQPFLNVPQCVGDDEEDEDDFTNEVSTRAFTYVRSESAVAAIVRQAAEKGAMIVFTIADPVLRDQALRMSELSDVPAVDLFGPLWHELADFLDTEAAGIPMGQGRPRHDLSDSYFKRIEAVEFTLKADDGRSPWLLKEADVVLVGVSRTGKTPLSVVISQTMGLKVANVPLVLEVPPPPELLDNATIDPNRVFCLSANPNELRRIRTTRLERRNVRAVEEKRRAAGAPSQVLGRGGQANGDRRQSTYADRDYVLKDLKRARDLALAQNWTMVDVTGRAVEESASLIGEMLNSRFVDSVETIY